MCSRTRENNKNKVGPVIWDTLYYPSIKTADSSRDEDEGKLHERLELRESALSIVWSLISKGSASDSPPEVRQLVTITKHQSSQFIVPPFHHVFLINIHLTHHSLLPPHPHVLTLSYIRNLLGVEALAVETASPSGAGLRGRPGPITPVSEVVTHEAGS